MAETRLRLYAPGDEAQILALRQRVFHHRLDETSWRRQFLEGPVGPAVIVVAERDGHIVGHHAHVPARMSYQRREYRATRGVDIMVAPEARGAKLSLKLHQFARAEVGDGADFHYSTPNPVAQAVAEGLPGLTIVGPTPPVELWLNPAFPLRGKPRWRPVRGALRTLGRAWVKAAALRQARPAAAGPPLVILDCFDERCDRLWAECGARYGLTILRDSRFLNWRYAGPGLTRLAAADGARVYGWLVYRLWDYRGWRGVHLVDLVAADALVAERLLRAARAEFRRQGRDAADAWSMPHAPDWPVMQRLGFRPRPYRNNLTARPYPGCRLPPEVFQRRENWHLTLAESDGV